MATGTGTSYTCSSGKCACASGYQRQQESLLDVNPETGLAETKVVESCFRSGVGSNFSVGTGGTCIVGAFLAYTDEAVQVCGTNHGCYLCPEDDVVESGYGYCRSTVTVVQQQNGQNQDSGAVSNLQPASSLVIIATILTNILKMIN